MQKLIILSRIIVEIKGDNIVVKWNINWRWLNWVDFLFFYIYEIKGDNIVAKWNIY
jgi:hypothetical protein